MYAWQNFRLIKRKPVPRFNTSLQLVKVEDRVYMQEETSSLVFGMRFPETFECLCKFFFSSCNSSFFNVSEFSELKLNPVLIKMKNGVSYVHKLWKQIQSRAISTTLKNNDTSFSVYKAINTLCPLCLQMWNPMLLSG